MGKKKKGVRAIQWGPHIPSLHRINAVSDSVQELAEDSNRSQLRCSASTERAHAGKIGGVGLTEAAREMGCLLTMSGREETAWPALSLVGPPVTIRGPAPAAYLEGRPASPPAEAPPASPSPPRSLSRV